MRSNESSVSSVRVSAATKKAVLKAETSALSKQLDEGELQLKEKKKIFVW